jgi:hypothetical protein
MGRSVSLRSGLTIDATVRPIAFSRVLAITRALVWVQAPLEPTASHHLRGALNDHSTTRLDRHARCGGPRRLDDDAKMPTNPLIDGVRGFRGVWELAFNPFAEFDPAGNLVLAPPAD